MGIDYVTLETILPNTSDRSDQTKALIQRQAELVAASERGYLLVTSVPISRPDHMVIIDTLYRTQSRPPEAP